MKITKNYALRTMNKFVSLQRKKVKQWKVEAL